jgi:tol-pal system protein YbgF
MAAQGPHHGARAVLAGAIAFALLAAASAPAHALFSDDEARRAIIDVRGRVELQNRRLDELSAKLQELTGRVEQLQQIAKGQLELQNQIAALREEVARLRGQLEVQTNELAQTQRQQRQAFAELDARVKRFEPVQVQIDGKTASVEVEEQRTYDAALATLRSGDFGGSLAAFQQFRQRWPGSAYTAGVLFWIGSAQYALKDYKASIATHQQMLARFPDHPRTPDALLNIGLAQLESGDKRGARASLQLVIDRHPEAPAAQLARDRLATIR